MGVGPVAPLELGLGDAALAIPERGLRDVLSAWSGRGDLPLTLAASLDDPVAERQWTAHDVRRRAHRILLQELTPLIARWPRTIHAWLDALPAQTAHRREQSSSVVAGVDWVSTRIRSGWPPASFDVRRRKRAPHTLLLASLRWTLDVLREIEDDASRVESSVVEAAMPQLGIALSLLEEEPLASVAAERPSFEDVRSVSREGRPWSGVAAVTRELVDVQSSAEEWAMRLVAPDPELCPTLFHLGVLGAVLAAVDQLGGAVVSTSPLSGVSARPAYAIGDSSGGSGWDLWFEAGGIWSRYGRSSPYVEATARLSHSAMPIKPDILLVRPDEAALILECKYSARIETVGRAGVIQAMAYAVEVSSRLAPRVEAYVVAPDGVVAEPTRVETEVGPIGVVAPADLPTILERFWAG